MKINRAEKTTIIRALEFYRDAAKANSITQKGLPIGHVATVKGVPVPAHAYPLTDAGDYWAEKSVAASEVLKKIRGEK